MQCSVTYIRSLYSDFFLWEMMIKAPLLQWNDFAHIKCLEEFSANSKNCKVTSYYSIESTAQGLRSQNTLLPHVCRAWRGQLGACRRWQNYYELLRRKAWLLGVKCVSNFKHSWFYENFDIVPIWRRQFTLRSPQRNKMLMLKEVYLSYNEIQFVGSGF